MKKFLLFLLTILPTFVLALNVYPMVNRVSAKPGDEVVVKLQLANTSGTEEKTKVNLHDFIIAGRSYIYNAPDYPYSLKNWIEVPATEVVLEPGEVRDFEVKIKVPVDFSGAQAFGALSFEFGPEKPTGGGVIARFRIMSIIILDIEGTRKDIEMDITDAKFYDLSEDAPKEYKEKYGDFGTVMVLKIKNTGNAVLALKGEMRVVSREFGKIVMSRPLSNETFVVFPEREEEFTFFSDAVFPPGKLSVQFEGVSQGVKVAKSFEVVAFEKKKLERLAVRMNPDMMLFKIERPVINEKFQIQNLTFEKLKISPKVKEKPSFITILPRRATLAPYAAGNFYLKVDTRKAKLRDGDNIYHLTVESPDPKVEVFGEPLIILRHGIGKTDHMVSMTESSTETKQATIVVENTGDMLLEFQVVERLPLRTNSLSKVFLVLPGEKKKISFKYSVSDVMARNAVLLRWRIYREKEWKEEKLPWPESD